MPLYEYVCSTCRSRFERLRPMDRAGQETPCPDCGTPAAQVLSVFASFSKSAGGELQAIAGGGGCGACAGGDCACCSVA